MTIKNLILLLIVTSIAFTSCEKDEVNEGVKEETALEIKTVKNLHAPQTGGERDPQTGQASPIKGEFTKFSFAKGQAVTDDSWDIAFRNSTIIVNGGAKVGLVDEPERKGSAAVSIVSNVFADITSVPAASTFKQDEANTYAIPTGSNNGWYSYDMTTHIISPIAGKILVVKTHDGKYAKVEILSFYEGAPTNPVYTTAKSPYYTFKYAYQPSGISLK